MNGRICTKITVVLKLLKESQSSKKPLLKSSLKEFPLVSDRVKNYINLNIQRDFLHFIVCFVRFTAKIYEYKTK